MAVNKYIGNTRNCFDKAVHDYGYLLAAMVVLLMGLLLGVKYLSQSPAFIHAWAQADHYALAVCFTDNGHDFFHPETMVCNKQFPHTWMVDDGNAVTAVDFPIHEYLIGWLMTLFGTTAPWVFRAFTLLISLIGIWFLFAAARELTDDSLKSLLPPMVALTSPLYAYYFASYLPSAPALALSMAGLWAYARYYKKGKLVYWHLAIAMMALATLIRTSQAVMLVAVCGFELLRVFRRETSMWNKVPSVAAAAVAIVGYMLWNAHLRNEYGSLFLNYLLPPRDWDDVHVVFNEIHWHWRFDYFSQIQHWIVALACVAALVSVLWCKFRRKGNADAQGTEQGAGALSLWWLAAIWWLGELFFFAAMFRQYQNHDYYFLDSFFLPILFVLILSLKALPRMKGVAAVISLAVLVLLGGTMFNEAKHKVADRCWEGDRAYITSQRFEGSDQWLDGLGVPRDARILAFLAYPQNGPLLQMGRKGYSVIEYDENIVGAALRFPFDYIVMENENYEQYIAEHDDMFTRMSERVADNGTLSLFILHTDEKP